MTLQGWRPGLNKVGLTKLLRDGGIGLHAATEFTGQILRGEEVRVHLGQFATLQMARAALNQIGVVTVRS